MPMKVMVAVKRVVDHNVKIRVKADGSDVDLNNLKMALNPFCEIAVEEAVRLKEQGIASEVIAVSIGPVAVQEQLRTALALGADRAVHIDAPSGLEPLSVATLLQALYFKEQPQLVLLGKQSIDSDNNQVGQMLSALCHLPQATCASRLEKAGDGLQVTCEVDGGLRVLALNLPAVVTVDLRLNEPRYAKLPDIMKAKKKPLGVCTPAELGVELVTRLTLLGVEPPAERSAGIKVGSASDLVDKLRHEAKVVA